MWDEVPLAATCRDDKAPSNTTVEGHNMALGHGHIAVTSSHIGSKPPIMPSLHHRRSANASGVADTLYNRLRVGNGETVSMRHGASPRPERDYGIFWSGAQTRSERN
jgi:hypothetical protein